MSGYPKLNFPPCRFRLSRGAGAVRLWDGVRKLWVVLTPEEWVRQHLVKMITDVMGVPAAAIVLEYPVDVHGMPQRADLVVVARDMRPLLIAECKAFDVEIDARVYAQGVRYNAVAGAKYMLLTNGRKHYCYLRGEDGEYSLLEAFPDLSREFGG